MFESSINKQDSIRETKTVGYFPGCSLEGTSKEYDLSLKKVSEIAGIELREIKDWNCCGATAAHNLNHLLSVALPARNLAIAEEQGLSDILVPCAACYNRLITAKAEIKENENLKNKIENIIEKQINDKIKPINILEFINKYVLNKISDKITNPIQKKVACYYGCLLVRPPKITKTIRYEDPLDMEEIMKMAGAKPIEWTYKTECCGAGFSVSRTEAVSRLSGEILEDAVDRGAEAIIVACPMCHANLDMRRKNIEKELGRKTNIPVLFITQALGLAMGIRSKELGLNRHIVSTSDFTKIKIDEIKIQKIIAPFPVEEVA